MKIQEICDPGGETRGGSETQECPRNTWRVVKSDPRDTEPVLSAASCSHTEEIFMFESLSDGQNFRKESQELLTAGKHLNKWWRMMKQFQERLRRQKITTKYLERHFASSLLALIGSSVLSLLFYFLCTKHTSHFLLPTNSLG